MIWVRIQSTDTWIAHEDGTTYRTVKINRKRSLWRVYLLGSGPDQLLYTGSFRACHIAARIHANAGRYARRRIDEIRKQAHAGL